MDLGGLIGQYGQAALFLGSLLEGETVVALGGLAAHRGYLSPAWVVAIATAGAFLGDQIYFALGRRFGWRLLARYPRLKPSLERARALLERHDTELVLAMRFLYGLRIAGPLAVGMSRIPWPRFAILNLLSAVLWAGVFAAAGYALADALERVLGDLRRIEPWVFAALAVAGAALWLFRRGRLAARARS